MCATNSKNFDHQVGQSTAMGNGICQLPYPSGLQSDNFIKTSKFKKFCLASQAIKMNLPKRQQQLRAANKKWHMLGRSFEVGLPKLPIGI